MAATGRNTLKRQYDKIDAPPLLALGGPLEDGFIKKMCVAAKTGDRESALWRA